MNPDELKKLNPHISIKIIGDEAFASYGKLITEYDFSDLISFMERNTEIPAEGNFYIASVPELEEMPVKRELENEFYGEMPIQIGYCNGQNSTLNGLEYHKGSEVDIAVTDLVLMLGKLQQVRDKEYDVKDIEIFYVPKGTALQLYETTLHFSPCKVVGSGFKCVVVLPKGTNTELKTFEVATPKDVLLFAKNKWLIAHPQRIPLIQRGAYPGIKGENIEIKCI
ncbi:DUF4867 family protein [Parabacteroides pacaensis]|uniref:DUF4867 family protein n=1 Tax=Parabacteroides pacaensis TaxID=2086575 RepID=UPI000D0F420D|nr:DUF4867 family protein [Parabacteroides pacaensis]